MKKKVVLSAVLGFLLLMGSGISSVCHAEVVTGQAPIVNGDTAKAKQDAMKDAMRTLLEQKVGVQVTSETQVEMGMVVRDEILSRSTGCILVNKVLREWQNGGLFCVEADLTANEKQIETAVADLKSRLQALANQQTSRSTLVLAVSGRDENGQPKAIESVRKYIQARLGAQGFTVGADDEINEYLDAQKDLDNPQVSVEVRRRARNSFSGANAILRGTLTTQKSVRQNGFYEAMVHASFEVVGIDSNLSDSFDDYFTAVDADKDKAIHKAEEMAVSKAAESLGKQALSTVQTESQGADRLLKMVLVVNGMTDRNAQLTALRQKLGGLRCRIIRSGFTGGTLQMLVEASGYATVDDLSAAIGGATGLQPDNDNENAAGAKKLYFSY